jgi:hypothetical protein
MLGCNYRNLVFHDSLDDTSAGRRDLQRLSRPRVSVDSELKIKGLNFLEPNKQRLLKALRHGEFNIHGYRRTDFAALVPISPSAFSRQLARLGRSTIAPAYSITRLNVIPAMTQTA